MIAIDTNIVSLIMSGKDPGTDGLLYVPFVVRAEVYYGIAVGGNSLKYRLLTDDLFASGSFVLSDGLGVDVIEHYVEVFAHLKRNGTPVSPNDLWIAAECIALGLPLLTLDNDFIRIPQLAKV